MLVIYGFIEIIPICFTWRSSTKIPIFLPAQPCVLIQEQLHVSVRTVYHNNYSLYSKTVTTYFLIIMNL